MKSAFAFASAAALGQAVNVQEGYVIDLCPTDAQASPITMPSSTQLLGMTQAEGFVVAPPARTTGVYGLGAATRWNQLNNMKSMYQTEMIKEGLAAAAYEELASRFEEETEDCVFEPGMIEEKNYLLERLGAIQAAFKPGMADEETYLMERLGEIRAIGAIAGEKQWSTGYGDSHESGYGSGAQMYYPGASAKFAVGQMIAPAAYNPNVGIIERESFLPGMIQSNLAQIPGAYRGDSLVQTGTSFIPDSYTPGSYAFAPSCTGQAVTVYPEREPRVLWCGERDLQGNQTLKRTNIHHNYVHDINQYHNYHNRTRHAARQYNSMEKDCSCKGVGVEATYKCPPGIEAPAARAVAASFINSGVGSFKQTCPLGLTRPSVPSTCPCLNK